MPDSSTLSVVFDDCGAWVLISFLMGLVVIFWTGEFPPTELIELMGHIPVKIDARGATFVEGDSIALISLPQADKIGIDG